MLEDKGWSLSEEVVVGIDEGGKRIRRRMRQDAEIRTSLAETALQNV